MAVGAWTAQRKGHPHGMGPRWGLDLSYRLERAHLQTHPAHAELGGGTPMETPRIWTAQNGAAQVADRKDPAVVAENRHAQRGGNEVQTASPPRATTWGVTKAMELPKGNMTKHHRKKHKGDEI